MNEQQRTMTAMDPERERLANESLSNKRQYTSKIVRDRLDGKNVPIPHRKDLSPREREAIVTLLLGTVPIKLIATAFSINPTTVRQFGPEAIKRAQQIPGALEMVTELERAGWYWLAWRERWMPPGDSIRGEKTTEGAYQRMKRGANANDD